MIGQECRLSSERTVTCAEWSTSMARRRETPTPHREFFRAVTIDETVALSCTCSRGADHWYAEPAGGAGAPQNEGTRLGARLGKKGATESGAPTLNLRSPRRSPDRAGLVW
jgi:hypothetical protein